MVGASSEGCIDDCIEICQMTIKLRVLDSSGGLVTSITQPNGKFIISLPPETQNRKSMVSLVSNQAMVLTSISDTRLLVCV